MPKQTGALLQRCRDIEPKVSGVFARINSEQHDADTLKIAAICEQFEMKYC